VSTNALEKLLWTVASDPGEAQDLRSDVEAYLEKFRLDDKERALLMSWDVTALASRAVNPMLLMMAFTAVNGLDKVPVYMMQINGPGEASPPQ